MSKTQATNKTIEVLRYLKTHKRGITSMEAIEMFGATRLSAIIFNLRKRGYIIETIKMDTIDRYGNPVQYGKYILKGKVEEE